MQTSFGEERCLWSTIQKGFQVSCVVQILLLMMEIIAFLFCGHFHHKGESQTKICWMHYLVSFLQYFYTQPPHWHCRALVTTSYTLLQPVTIYAAFSHLFGAPTHFFELLDSLNASMFESNEFKCICLFLCNSMALSLEGILFLQEAHEGTYR